MINNLDKAITKPQRTYRAELGFEFFSNIFKDLDLAETAFYCGDLTETKKAIQACIADSERFIHELKMLKGGR